MTTEKLANSVPNIDPIVAQKLINAGIDTPQKFKKLILLDFEKDYFEEKYLRRLKKITENLVFVNEPEIQKRNEKSKDAEAILIRYFTPVHKPEIEAMPDLKYIGTTSTAMDNLDTNYAKEKGIMVANLVNYASNGIAEFIFGALLSHIRHIPEAIKNVEKGDLMVHKQYTGWELKGKKFGILGLENIGQRVGEIALGMGMEVQYHSRTHKANCEAKGMNYIDLEDLVKTSDVLGIFLEFNENTKNIMTDKLIKNIKNGAVIISSSHTELFDFSSLSQALIDDHFTFLQTYFSTLPNEHCDALTKLPNVVLYPSIAIQTAETKKIMQEMVVGNIENFCKTRMQN